MRLYYNLDGIVIYAIFDKDIFAFSNEFGLFSFDIDEIEVSNKALCHDLKKTEHKFDINRQHKYYIQNNELYFIDNWIEYIDEVMI